jgi:hypothetical protein
MEKPVKLVGLPAYLAASTIPVGCDLAHLYGEECSLKGWDAVKEEERQEQVNQVSPGEIP